MQYYDENGSLVGVSNIEERAFEHGSQIMTSVSNDLPFTAYEYSITVKEETYYSCVNNSLDLDVTALPAKVIPGVTNTGEITARHVDYHILFLKDGDAVSGKFGYIGDSDSEIKPGKTQYKEEKFSEEFDDALVFISGYGY